MDKPRWALTWLLAIVAVSYVKNDSFWWMVLKLIPFTIFARLVEEIRSRIQNGGYL